MEQQEFDAQYYSYQQAVESYLQHLFREKTNYSDLYEAMRYSFLSGGKRIRPVLVLEFARLGKLDWHKALPVACGLELLHTYSLIHDDLPCMDDDTLRRGKPTNHKVYGETMAILAADALQTEAFRSILSAPELPMERKGECALLLSNAAGADGMVAGQVLDTLHNVKTQKGLTEVHTLKTGALIRAAVGMGCAAAGAPDTLRKAADTYAAEIGLAFQIRDDMLDVIGDEQMFGKPIGSDQEENKITFVDLLGLDACGREVEACNRRAKEAISSIEGSEFLMKLSDTLVFRTH